MSAVKAGAAAATNSVGKATSAEKLAAARTCGLGPPP
ncbi:MAG: hypothetical protein JWM61_1083 [Micrococcaceae bacterium]|nr:hypothetical protein [Micrococcaceae bacterium]